MATSTAESKYQETSTETREKEFRGSETLGCVGPLGSGGEQTALMTMAESSTRAAAFSAAMKALSKCWWTAEHLSTNSTTAPD